MVKEVITSDDGSDCGGDIDMTHSFSGRLDRFSQTHPEHAAFFESRFGSSPSDFKEFDSKTQSRGSESDIFMHIEDPGSHVPEFSASSKTSTVRKQHVTKSYKMADEAGSDALHEGEPRTTVRGRAKSRAVRGTHA